jgi:PhnB protein
MAEHHDRPFPGVTPFLSVRDRRGQEAIDFYVKAFGAEVPSRNLAQDGERIMQAELRLNGGAMMLADQFPEYAKGPGTAPEGVTLHLQVDDADLWWSRATAAGCEIVMPIGDQFWGDRYGQLKDPFGFEWSIGAPIRQG